MKTLIKLFLSTMLALPAAAFSVKVISFHPEVEVMVDQLAAEITNTFTTIKECQPNSQAFQEEEYNNVVSFFGTAIPNIRARECVAENLQKTNDSICAAKQELVQMMNSDNYNYLNPIMYRVQSMRRSYQNRLYDLSKQNAASIGKYEGGDFSRYLNDQEAQAYESIFFAEAVYECTPFL